MLRTFSLKWLGTFALIVSPVAYGQGTAAQAYAAGDTPTPVSAPEAQVPDTPTTAKKAAAIIRASGEAPSTGRQATLAELNQIPADDEREPLFGPKPANTFRETLLAYTRKEYKPLRRSEFYSSGFLTENQNLPWATIVGPVTPSQIGSPIINDAMPFTTIAIEAPSGVTYQIGDTLLLAQRGGELKPFGNAVLPTGLARVTDTVSGRYLATVEAIYGPIRPGQVALPAEKFTPGGGEHAVPVSDGVRGTFLGGPKRQELKALQMVAFIDKGRQDGVAAGDIFEVRRKAERLDGGQQRANQLLATLQIVHVGEHSATGRYLDILLPDVAQGMEVHQVAKLPS
jgi:hypothetical protein